MAENKDHIIIKKYANRRLYNTSTSSYVTLENLVKLVRDDKDFVVEDAKTGADLTHSILTQIIVDEEAKGQSLLPTNFLKQLIRFYGQGMQQFVPSYLELSLESLSRQQDRYREQFGSSAFETMQSQTRQNLAMFEHSLSMFNPFAMPGLDGLSSDDDAENGAQDHGGKAGSKKSSGKTRASVKNSDSDGGNISELQAQVAAMQKQLDRIEKK